MSSFQPIPSACVSEYRIIFTQTQDNQKKDGIQRVLRELSLLHPENGQAKLFQRESIGNDVITTAHLMAGIDVVERLRSKIKCANITDNFIQVEMVVSVFKVRFDNMEQRHLFEVLKEAPETTPLPGNDLVLYFTNHNISDFHFTFHEIRKADPTKWNKCEILIQENYLCWTGAELREEKLNEAAQEEGKPIMAKPRKL